MRTPASISGHPIHPMIVPIAIGGFILSFVFDIVCLKTGDATLWAPIAYYTMIGGIAGALCAAIFGFVDMLSLSGYTKRVALTHMGINLLVVAMYVFNAWLRHGNPESLRTPMLLSLVALVLLVISGWLGGKMVYEAGVGVVAGEPEPAARTNTTRHIHT